MHIWPGNISHHRLGWLQCPSSPQSQISPALTLCITHPQEGQVPAQHTNTHFHSQFTPGTDTSHLQVTAAKPALAVGKQAADHGETGREAFPTMKGKIQCPQDEICSVGNTVSAC